MQMTTTKITAEKSMSFIWINCVGASACLSLTLSCPRPFGRSFLWSRGILAAPLWEGREGEEGSGELRRWKRSFCSFP